jgi:hypothetical protein
MNIKRESQKPVLKAFPALIGSALLNAYINGSEIWPKSCDPRLYVGAFVKPILRNDSIEPHEIYLPRGISMVRVAIFFKSLDSLFLYQLLSVLILNTLTAGRPQSSKRNLLS